MVEILNAARVCILVCYSTMLKLWIVVGQGATQLVRKQNGSSPLRKNPACQGGIGTLKEIFLTPEASGGVTTRQITFQVECAMMCKTHVLDFL